VAAATDDSTPAVATRGSGRSSPGGAETDEFAAAWEAFFRAVRRAKGRAGAQPPEHGLSVAQYHLLAPLGCGEPLTVRALAESAAVAPPTATRMLDGLERDGVVTRTPLATDRRCVHVDLTEAGRAALAQTESAVRDARARVAASLSPAEREQAAALLRRLALVVEEQLA
jgi:MarR family transcriptional regulator, organic hydroperoxide resistance regulator